MDKILHDPKDPKLWEYDPKDPKLWELWYIFLIMGNAGFCPPAVWGSGCGIRDLGARTPRVLPNPLDQELEGLGFSLCFKWAVFRT